MAVLGSLVTSHVVGSFATGFAAAGRIGWAVMAGCGLVIIVLGVASTGSRARETAARTADLFEAPVPVGSR